MSMPPLSLYVHLPWCVKKCPYCDFNSHARASIPEDDYLISLLRDLDQDLKYVQGRKIHSLFFGGGTPSLMSGPFYLRFMDALRARIEFEENAEVTLEANPGASDAKHFQDYAKAGINRVSIGAQSFQDKQLLALGRIHSAEQIPRAVDSLRNVGISNYNIDLMHGLPDQTVSLALQDLKSAMALEPAHLSWYQLTIEQNTEFFSKPPVLPEDDLLWQIIEQGSELLSANGFKHYEVSAFSKPGMQSRHNLNYWHYGDYIGLGAGAHSKVSDDSGRLLRYRKSRMPEAYMADRVSYRVGEEYVEKDAQVFEFMMNALRLREGVEENVFEQRTQLRLNDIDAQLKDLRKEGLMREHRIQLSDKGFLFLNSVLERFL